MDMEPRTIVLAGGCFWGVEKYLSEIPGVLRTEVGYANGATANPTYEQVCRAGTGHSEAVLVEYDPTQVTLPFLLELFYQVIDPTSVNRQGNDVGEQYRTGIYYTEPADLPAIQDSLRKLQAAHSQPLAIEVGPLENYYPAEAYHQQYLDKNPGGYCHIPPSAFAAAKQAIDPSRAAASA